ncbi:alcohol dehydrogenase [alpha proteobacterium U9-1i]|nr:alcohol dehydrogenase [alpha proteobacterium U9-1i]
MKALVLRTADGPEALHLEDWPKPQPQAGDVLVRVRASALNRRDFTIVNGKHVNTKLPCVLGGDGAGVVEAVGDGVDKISIGQEVVLYPAREWGDDETRYGVNFRVLGMPDQGTFAEYICTPATDVAPKPAHLSFEQAAAIPLAGVTAWRAVVTQGEVRAGKRVLVTGAGGGAATFAVQWAAQLGADVFVTSGDDAKIERAKTLGAKGGVNYRDPDLRAKLKELTRGVDLIIDSAGGNDMQTLIDTLRPGGRYVFFGSTLGNPTKPLDVRALFLKHVRLQGTAMGSLAEFKAMMRFVEENRIEPVIDQILPLERGADGLRAMLSFTQMGKIVLRNA